ncbi:long-chain fatty acid--CoA ligase [Nocardioides sp. CER19]|uniref:long-chain-fatty-acid--CoA ligase n=1 Tax=Nocardioides sp. CER19 TaxID=3038538 RepID=UPI002449E5E8|nr:long-chain fatty acid--CoA ligase [Nocardioides sp. CER19]MDH2416122.1 long-chain fatty acid--CoA ligase [Nocardioides sp. CER19]
MTMSFNLATMLRESAASAGADRPLAYFGTHTFTYSEVDANSGRVASALRAAGLEPGDKVAVQLPNVPEFLFAYFGILKAGLVMVPLNPLLARPEIAYQLDDSDAKLVITHAVCIDRAAGAAADAGSLPVYIVGDADARGAKPFGELLQAPDAGLLHPTSSDDTAVLLYTSGTTGKPKGAELSHFQLFMNSTTSGALFGLSADDVSVAVLPLFHVFGLSAVLGNAVRYGASMVLIPRFDANDVLDAIERHQVTVFSGVPTMFSALLQADTTGRDLSSLRAAVSGGASIPGEVIRAFEEKYPNAVILEGYGLSETASTATFNVSADQRKVLSIGRPIWGVELRIMGSDGEPLPPGKANVGEIVLRGHVVTKGYYKNPEATAAAIRDGWLQTGDLAYRDEDGYVFIVDRVKDLVIRGGYNVYPREVEEVLYEHPAVAEAAVVGRPDQELGEEVVAFVALRPGASADTQDIVAFTKERLAAYKYPREIHVVSELPKGATGKILKRELRDQPQ